MSELSNILQQFLEELATDIKAKVPVVTGKTVEGLEVKVTNPGTDLFVRVKGELLGPAYINTLEHGRGPTRKSGGGTKTLQESILEWVQAKNIQPTLKPRKSLKQTAQQNPQIGLSWAIAIKIHKEGNRLYRQGGKSGVLSVPLTNQRIENFIEVFNSKAARVLLNKVVQTIMA